MFARIEPEQCESCIIDRFSSLALSLPGQTVAIDGKTLRRTHDRAKGGGATLLVSAYATANALVLGQIRTEDKSNEITAILTLLEMLEFEWSPVTIDAMGCQKAIAELTCLTRTLAHRIGRVLERQLPLSAEDTYQPKTPEHRCRQRTG